MKPSCKKTTTGAVPDQEYPGVAINRADDNNVDPALIKEDVARLDSNARTMDDDTSDSVD